MPSIDPTAGGLTLKPSPHCAALGKVDWVADQPQTVISIAVLASASTSPEQLARH